MCPAASIGSDQFLGWNLGRQRDTTTPQRQLPATAESDRTRLRLMSIVDDFQAALRRLAGEGRPVRTVEHNGRQVPTKAGDDELRRRLEAIEQT
jgi:hypothetical protein